MKCIRILALWLFLLAPQAMAGVLLEGQLNGVSLRLEMGLDRSRVLATAGGIRHLVDLSKKHVYRSDGNGTHRHQAGGMDDGASALAYRLNDWSEGPPVAGHGSRYNVLQIGEKICGEVLSSSWMQPFMGEIQFAIELIQRVDERLRPVLRDECGKIPFTAFAGNGWPLFAGWHDETVFRADVLRFDYRADARQFELPRRFTQ